MKIIENLVHGSEEWLAWRRNGIGSSDIAAICGVCPYKKAIDIYNDKKGIGKNWRNKAMQRGIDYEDEARRVFRTFQRSPEDSWQPINIEHDKFPYFKASLDGYNSFTKQILEIKIPKREILELAKANHVPEHYRYQVQWQLFVSGAPMAFYFCYNPDTFETYRVVVFPDQEMIDILKEKAEMFWYDVLNDHPPINAKSAKAASSRACILLEKMLEYKNASNEALDQYKVLLAELLELEGMDRSIEGDIAALTLSERSTIDYKKAVEDAGIDLNNYKKPATKIWTIRAKKL